MTRISEDFVRALPKAEVHVHLEGAIELAELLEYAKADGRGLPGPAATLFDLSTHDDFERAAWGKASEGDGRRRGAGAAGLSGFLRFLDWECSLVNTPERAARIAYRFAVRQSASGIWHSDVIVNPTHWREWQGREAALFDALAAGFDEAEQDGLATAFVAASILRTQSADESRHLAEWIVAERPPRVVALSIDGNEAEAGRTSGRHAAAFEVARDGGLRRTVHAGESSGPEGVRDAIELLHAERIDHGVRAIEDPALVEELAERRITLNVCPRSNLHGLYADISEHPVERLRAAGVPVTVNTDDPAPIGTRLENEWTLCADAFGWDEARLVELARASVEASFATPERKRDMLAALAANAG